MIQDLTPKQITEKLWCGTVKKFKHDMLAHNIHFEVSVVDSEMETTYAVDCLKVNKVEIFYEHPDNEWDYIELTEISVERKGEIFIIECDFWSAAGMKLICKELAVKEI